MPRIPKAVPTTAWLMVGDERSYALPNDIKLSGERNGDGHLAAQRRIFRLEFIHFDHPLLRDEPREMAVIRVGA